LVVSGAIGVRAQGPGKAMPAMPPLPGGFQASPNSQNGQSPWKAAGVGDQMEGIKKNDLPVCFGNPKYAHVGYSWMMGGMQMVIDGMLREPEKPAFKDGAWHQNEPAGKMAYRGGVLEMRKIIYSPDIGIDAKGQCGATLDTYDAIWTAVAAGKMLQIEVHMFAGSKDAAKAVIDGLIDPLKAAVSKTK
jgi:hypothetical protein